VYDIVIKNGLIVDGSGKPAFKANLAIKNGKIAGFISSEKKAHEEIDVDGKVVSPGFIDIHRHADAAVFKEGFGELELRQGITSILNGACGLSIVPKPAKWEKCILEYLNPITGSLPGSVIFDGFGEYLKAVEKQNLPLNYGSFIGNGTLRMAVKGFEAGKLSSKEISMIHEYLKDSIKFGAFGVSMGLIYMPECMYDVEEIIKVLEPLKGGSLPIVTHVRGEGNHLIESLEEVILIAKYLEIPLHISHLKCVGVKNWRVSLEKVIALLDSAKKDGVKITCDVYPWEAGSTQLVQVLPPEYLEGGFEKTITCLKDKQQRKECKKIMESPQTYYENLIPLIGWENIVISSAPKNSRYEGKTVIEISNKMGIDPYDLVFNLLIEENCNVSIINYIASKDDIDTILKFDSSCIISDSLYPDSGKPHPRKYGTFPKIITEYVRERKLLTIEEAINKFTGKPAEIFNIKDKGLLKEGMDADIVIFDPLKIQTNASYKNPNLLATGFSQMYINGVLVNQNDNIISSSAGKLLKNDVRPC